MEKSTPILIAVVFVIIAAAVGGLWYADRAERPERAAIAAVTQCLAEKETIFYGAFWCPNCAEQKEIFGSSAKDLPYVECSTPDRSAQLPVCVDEGIEAYPTWEFADGTRCTGVMSPLMLAYRAGCALPEYGAEHTAESLYSELVEKPIRKRFPVGSADQDSLTEELERARTMIDLVLKTMFETDTESADTEQLLAAAGTVLHGCGPKGRGDADIEVTPVESGGE